jgi:hypothetical protein
MKLQLEKKRPTNRAPYQDFAAQRGVLKSCVPKIHFHAQEIEDKRDSHVQYTPNNFPTKAIDPYALLARLK